MLIDTHAHLTDEKYDNDRDLVISSLNENRVEKVFTVASLSSFIATTVSPFLATGVFSTTRISPS